ncbi:MAG: autotransporter outer membrane beta-barrel domain-containing protein, partial [Betaproteobacteria bacterium]|nr:autotransporter outer membrane beta-barrel domain-containing protein [Betaproteobacteria bacterium]
QKVGYSASSAYFGMHAGMGYIWKVSDKATLDMYGKYFWTRLKGDSVRLSTGHTVEFKDVDSHRLRVGGRYSRNVSETTSPYIGAAYEREFDGKAYAMTGGRDITPVSMRGNTGVAEVGLTYKPTKYQHLTIEAGVQGYTGKREGVAGSFQVRYKF